MEFSPASAIPGEETTLKVKALPHSLCGVGAVDQSVHVKEPGKTLTADQVTGSTKFKQKLTLTTQRVIFVNVNKVKMLQPVFISIFNCGFKFQMFELLPVSKVSGFPSEVEDAQSCLNVRQKRYIGRRPPRDDVNDAYSVFEVNSILFFQLWVVYAWKSKLQLLMTCS